jgi:hypothetical protein
MYVWWQIQNYFTYFLDIALLVEEIRQPIVGLWQTLSFASALVYSRFLVGSVWFTFLVFSSVFLFRLSSVCVLYPILSDVPHVCVICPSNVGRELDMFLFWMMFQHQCDCVNGFGCSFQHFNLITYLQINP